MLYGVLPRTGHCAHNPLHLRFVALRADSPKADDSDEQTDDRERPRRGGALQSEKRDADNDES